MNKLLFTKPTSIFFVLICLLSSCMEKDVYQGSKNKPLNPSEVFDFSLVKQVKLNIDYGFNNDYHIIFELYDQYPMIEEDDSWIKDETLTAVYLASTDKEGKYSGTISLRSDITEIWLYSQYLGTVSPVKISIANDEISFNQKSYIASLQAQTRGTTNNGYTHLDSWKLMPQMDWDIYGFSTNIEKELSLPPADILYSIKEVYSKVAGKRIKELHPEWLENNTTSEVKIIKDTELSLVFITSGAGWNNSVGYFTYPTGTVPTEASIQKILAFPNASPITKVSSGQKAGSLVCGHEVKLKYWNEEKQSFEDTFPAGVTVGWSLQGMGFNNGNIGNGMGTRYSYSAMNKDGAQRVVALRHEESDQIVAIGFEDNSDYDYVDAVFYLKIAESGAISPEGPVLPPVDPPANKENTITTSGTLAFEDQWPSQGDYDINDVVLEYRSTHYRNIMTNSVYKIVDEFSPIHNGGYHKIGFGYQLHKIDSKRLRSIEVSGATDWRVETEQEHPTIILFDNIRGLLGKKITVTMELDDVNGSDIASPYNPFIFANNRGTEVHLVNYPPTSNANMELFNTEDDVSNLSTGVFYISRFKDEVDLMPYCINLPTLNFKYSDEGVKIYDIYPDFIKWVKSNGKTNSNWYKK